MKRRRIKKTKEILEVKRKRTRKVETIPKIKTEFYNCTKTLKDGNGRICFREGGEYMLQRHVNANLKNDNAIILASEVWGMHVCNKNNWGSNFVKSDRVEAFTQAERDNFERETLVKYQVVTAPKRHRRAVLSDEKPKRVRKVKPTVKTKETTPKRKRVRKGGVPHGLLHPDAIEKARVVIKRKRRG